MLGEKMIGRDTMLITQMKEKVTMLKLIVSLNN